MSPAPTRLTVRLPRRCRPGGAGIHDGLQGAIVEDQPGQPGAIRSRQGLQYLFIAL
jgi:hypothetical protein